MVRVRYGFWRIFTLLRRDGFKDNHKRAHRIYKLEGLNLRSKRHRRSRAGVHRQEFLKDDNSELFKEYILSPVNSMYSLKEDYLVVAEPLNNLADIPEQQTNFIVIGSDWKKDEKFLKNAIYLSPYESNVFVCYFLGRSRINEDVAQ